MRGTLATTNIITLKTADETLPIIIAGALVVVVNITSSVCLSLSPDIEEAVIKTLNSIWMIFGVKPDEKEKAEIIEKTHYELANTNLFG